MRKYDDLGQCNGCGWHESRGHDPNVTGDAWCRRAPEFTGMSTLETRLRRYITAETAITDPIDVRFVWTGPARGVVTYAYPGESAEDLRGAALPVEGDLADEIRRLETGLWLPNDPRRHPLEGNGFTRANPEWVDTERIIGTIREAQAANEAWNEQIEAVADLAREAYERGHGIVIRMSRSRNEVTATESTRAVKGTAYVFDYDALNPTPDIANLSLITREDLRP